MEESVVEDNFDFLLPPRVVFVDKKVDYALMKKTDLEINKFIADEKKWRRLYDKLPDGGDNLKETLRRYEAELERRNKRKSRQEGYETDLFGERQRPVAGDVEAPLAKRLHSGRNPFPCDCLPDEKMRKIVSELLRIGLTGIDVGKAAENCYNDPVKFKVLFTLPSHMRKDYALRVLVSPPN